MTVCGCSIARGHPRAEGTRESAGFVALGAMTTRFSASLLYGDPSRARELLVSEPCIGLREGLERLLRDLCTEVDDLEHQEVTP